jgi:hypothetical protein
VSDREHIVDVLMIRDLEAVGKTADVFYNLEGSDMLLVELIVRESWDGVAFIETEVHPIAFIDKKGFMFFIIESFG